MDYIVGAKLHSSQQLNEIHKWLCHEMKGNYKEISNPCYLNWVNPNNKFSNYGQPNHFFHFENEEDKVKFILRWI